MRLILAVSADGHLARGPEDDMSWTGLTDKRLFRLLTLVGSVCVAGSRTWLQMPKLGGRLVLPLSREHGRVLDHPDGRQEAAMSLGKAFYRFPDAWLLGGPTVAMEALEANLVDQVYLCRAENAVLHEAQAAFQPDPAYRDVVSPWLMSRGEAGNAGTPWARRQRIQFDGTTVDVWSRRDACRP